MVIFDSIRMFIRADCVIFNLYACIPTNNDVDVEPGSKLQGKKKRSPGNECQVKKC